MRNRNAAKLTARRILGRARNGEPAFDRSSDFSGFGPFPSASEIRAALHGEPMNRGGPAPGHNDTRDLYLAFTVWKLHEAFDDLPPTRRTGDRDACACSIVAEVAAELGILPSARYSTVAKAWERFAHLR